MAEEYKSSKTRQVMNLINAPSSDINPLFLGSAQSRIRKKPPHEQTVEDSIKNYTVSKRGGERHTVKKSGTSSIHNPILHIPDDSDEAVTSHKSAHTAAEKITIDINRIFLADMLDDALVRFNTCHCDKCKEKITELILDSVPVKIITVSPADEKSVIDSYCGHTKKNLSAALVKIIVGNKRKPFHDLL